ncbi:hypothetical protein BGZ95_004782 [Linnemannia exigua]|uniref:F-box domain-containing protein n=1 Tax=Linnemannia exigua TaxID=604196 RepID=A0AAD4DH61_9FUNG|nr:hypothetical protein BGZ95_004782 [Linnemannia exigua]
MDPDRKEKLPDRQASSAFFSEQSRVGMNADRTDDDVSVKAKNDVKDIESKSKASKDHSDSGDTEGLGRKKITLGDMPAETLIHIGLTLPCREFGRFLQTNRTIHSCLNSHYVWHQRFTTRFGQTVLEDKLNSPNSNNPSKLSPPLTPRGLSQYNNHLDPVSAPSSPLPSAASSPRLNPSLPHTPPPNPSDDGSESDGNGNNGNGEGSSSSHAKRAPKGKGRRIDLRRTNMAPKEMLIDMYKQMSRLTLPAEDMMIAHMGNQFWRMIASGESRYGRLAELASVWWMDVVAVFYGVPPGRYKVQWRVKVTSDAPIVNTEFRAVLFDKHEDLNTVEEKPNTLTFKPTSKQEFIEQTDSQGGRVNKRPFRNLFKGFTTLELPGELLVEDDYRGVFVQIRNHDAWKSGLYIDYVRLVNVDEPEQRKESLVYGFHGQRVAAGNEPVDDEGEEYYPSTSSSSASSAGLLPWLQQVCGINPHTRTDPRPQFRSRAGRQFNPVQPSALLDVGARSVPVPNSTSTPVGGSTSSSQGGQGQSRKAVDEEGQPVERPDACLPL